MLTFRLLYSYFWSLHSSAFALTIINEAVSYVLFFTIFSTDFLIDNLKLEYCHINKVNLSLLFDNQISGILLQKPVVFNGNLKGYLFKLPIKKFIHNTLSMLYIKSQRIAF